MIDWVLVFARDLALAVWLGGLIVIDFVETPARFRVPALNRNQVGGGWARSLCRAQPDGGDSGSASRRRGRAPLESRPDCFAQVTRGSPKRRRDVAHRARAVYLGETAHVRGYKRA